uniref:Uncharacterized protein n=1 Tax=Davidia involucrata TaxID=16924 RepID=A0A5B7BRU3_DAVIN
MQTLSQKQTFERLQLPAKALSVVTGDQRIDMSQGCRKSCVASPRPPRMYTRSSSYHSKVTSGTHRHKEAPPLDKLRRCCGSKEILRRALTPSRRTTTWRWWNFRPTPSRLSNMSTA